MFGPPSTTRRTTGTGSIEKTKQSWNVYWNHYSPDCSGRKDCAPDKLGNGPELVVGRDPKKSPEIACSSRARNAISRPYFRSVPSSMKINSV